jgi:hypothetical protein
MKKGEMNRRHPTGLLHQMMVVQEMKHYHPVGHYPDLVQYA